MTVILTRNTDQLHIEVRAHTGALTKGTYWTGTQGCFIGCLTHSSDPAPAYERFGLPEPVMRIAESIFEALPAVEGQLFFDAFPDAVERDGKDLTRVHWAFLAAELRALPAVPENVQAVIDPVIAGMDLKAAGKEWSEDAAYAAYAAYAAANAAYAAYAANAANAARAAHAARAAANAAYAAAYAALAPYAAAYAALAGDAADEAAIAGDEADEAAYAARAAAAARLRQRDTLLRLIAEAQ